MTDCWRCGSDDHAYAGCDQPPYPPPPPAQVPETIWRRAADEIAADPHGWAERIRADMGWPSTGTVS